MIKITADSTCDLSAQILAEMDISLVPLHIIVDGKEYDDGINITATEVINYVEIENKVCKTAAVNSYEYYDVFTKYASEYEAVIHICLGSQFSSCYQNATIAAQEFENVYVIDSQNLSTGQGYLVYEAALMAQNGLAASEICATLRDLVPKIDASFVINTLEYLYKGGRCSGLEAFGARLLQIKPSIEVVDGEMSVGKKYRGSLERSIENYIKERLTIDADDIDYSRIFLTHCHCPDQIVKKAKETIAFYADFAEIIVTEAGCTITSHCGPNTLGILYKRKNPKRKHS